MRSMPSRSVRAAIGIRAASSCRIPSASESTAAACWGVPNRRRYGERTQPMGWRTNDPTSFTGHRARRTGEGGGSCGLRELVAAFDGDRQANRWIARHQFLMSPHVGVFARHVHDLAGPAIHRMQVHIQEGDAVALNEILSLKMCVDSSQLASDGVHCCEPYRLVHCRLLRVTLRRVVTPERRMKAAAQIGQPLVGDVSLPRMMRRQQGEVGAAVGDMGEDRVGLQQRAAVHPQHRDLAPRVDAEKKPAARVHLFHAAQTVGCAHPLERDHAPQRASARRVKQDRILGDAHHLRHTMES